MTETNNSAELFSLHILINSQKKHNPVFWSLSLRIYNFFNLEKYSPEKIAEFLVALEMFKK